MTSLTDLLKEGTKHFTGVSEATLNNIEAVRGLADITKTSFGPRGMNKMIINHLEKLFVTSDAATIIKELDVIHPAAKMAVLASQMQEQEFGDATNLVIMFCGELLNNAEALIQKGLHPSEIINGYSIAGKKALELLEELVVGSVDDMKNEQQIIKALTPVLAAKQFGYEHMLAPMIARACIQVCPKNPKNFNVDNVRVAKILGGGIFDTRVVKGHILTRDAEGTIKHVTNAKVVVFAGGIDVAKTETKDTILIHNAEELMDYSKSEERAIEDVMKKISESGAKVIVSGGAISEMALHFMERYKMMVLKTMSKFDLRRICKAVGATPLARLGAPTPEEMGFCDVVTVEEIGSTKVTIFRQEKEESGISTLVIRASTQNLLDDVERAVDDGVNAYKTLAKDGRYVPGAGATEIELARRLQQWGDTKSGLAQYAIKKYGEAFEIVPRSLAENAGLKSTDVLSNLYAQHSKGANAGLDVEEEEVRDAVAAGIVDSVVAKSNAIRLATDAAVTILRVDQIIMSKPAGGPKPPKQGPMDADD